MGHGTTRAKPKPAEETAEAVATARSQLRRLGVRAVKGLGQHFLVDRAVLETILSAAALEPDDTVIEVGPGLGILTEQLVTKAGSVVAIEVDPMLASALGQALSRYPGVKVIQADVLDTDPADLLPAHSSAPAKGYKVVANLPYYVASPILRRVLEASLKPRLMVVMLQKEVAQSIAGGPGAMSILAVSVQLYGKPTIVDYVPATSFYPRPKVDSAILCIQVYPRPVLDVSDIDRFFEVVRAGFSAPRKQLRNSLALGLGLSPQEATRVLNQAGVDPERRPQALSLEEWGGLYRVLAGEEAR